MIQVKQKKTILLIDDDKFLIKLMSKIMLNAGYDVITASQGKQAIKLLSQKRVDIIVLDLMMPEMDGFAFLYWLRQRVKLDIPTLVQTAMVKADTKRQVMDAGASALIFKPIKETDFISTILGLEKQL